MRFYQLSRSKVTAPVHLANPPRCWQLNNSEQKFEVIPTFRIWHASVLAETAMKRTIRSTRQKLWVIILGIFVALMVVFSVLYPPLPWQTTARSSTAVWATPDVTEIAEPVARRITQAVGYWLSR